MSTFDDQMAEVVRRQREHANASHAGRIHGGRMRIIVTNAPKFEEKHGIVAGRAFEVLRSEPRQNWLGHAVPPAQCPVWIMGDAGEEVMLFVNEYEIDE